VPSRWPNVLSNWSLKEAGCGKRSNEEEAREWNEKAVEWMKKNAADNKKLIRFRAEAAELLGANGPKDSDPSPAPTE
jgi:hypothetical protein